MLREEEMCREVVKFKKECIHSNKYVCDCFNLVFRGLAAMRASFMCALCCKVHVQVCAIAMCKYVLLHVCASVCG